MNLTLFAVLLFGLQLFYWFVAKQACKKVNSHNEYFFAENNTGVFSLAMTLLAAQVGGGLILGAAEEAYKFGWLIILYPLGASVGLMLLGTGLGKSLMEFRVSTTAEILEVAYGSTNLKKAASLLSISTLFAILVAQILASFKFLASIGLGTPAACILFWSIVILYTVQGGLKAVIATDTAQAALFCGIFMVCFGTALQSNITTASFNASASEFSAVAPKLTGWLLCPLLFILIGQDIAQKCFASHSPAIVQKGSLWAGICTMLICCLPIAFGVLAKNGGLDIPEGASVLMVSIEKYTNPTLAAFAGCAVLAAIVSSASSLINAISSNLFYDFKSAGQAQEPLHMAKFKSIIISIAAIMFAFFCHDIVDLLIQSFELSLSCLFVPTAFALYQKRGHLLSAQLAMANGALGFGITRIYPMECSEIICLGLSFAAYMCGNLLINYKEQHENSKSC